MKTTCSVDGLTPSEIRRMLSGLPTAPGYDLDVKPLRYRRRPHLAAMTDFKDKLITLQVPEPFYPFVEPVPYGAQRLPGKGIKFKWLLENVEFLTPRQVLRFLYCHEWMHWYLREQLGRRSAAETTCDRFALYNSNRPVVTVEDAISAMRRRRN
jgi:hypothetical protein